MNRRVLIMLGAVLLVLGGIATACSDTGDLEDRVTALSEQVAALDQAAERAAMIAALHVLDAGGRLHEIDMALHERGEIEAGTSGYVNAALLAIASTNWPEEVRPQADDLRTKLEQFATALDGEDVAVVAAASRAAHDAAHRLHRDCSDFIAEAVGLSPMEEDHEGPTPTGAMDHMGGSPTPTGGMEH